MPVLINIIIRCCIVYIFILFAFRVFGKRQIGQMSPLDLVLLLLLSNAVQNAMTGPDTTIQGGIVAAGTLLVLNFLLNYVLYKSKWARKTIEGKATILINHGVIQQQNLENEQISTDEIMQALREHDVAHIEDVRIAVLELDGHISVVKKDDVSQKQPTRARRRVKFTRYQS